MPGLPETVRSPVEGKGDKVREAADRGIGAASRAGDHVGGLVRTAVKNLAFTLGEMESQFRS